MNENKPIRRHSRLRRFLMNAGYYSVKGLRIPVGIIFTGLTVLCVVTTPLISYLLLFLCYEIYLGDGYDYDDRLCALKFLSGFFPVLLIGDYVLYRTVRAYSKLPKGHVLNPLPPAVNEILPEAEVLVRASSVSETGQKETLLRPAGSAAEADPQTLLRASNTTE